MTSEQKALRACADYARLSADIRRLTRAISDSLAACSGVNGHLQLTANWPFDQESINLMNADETHLKRAYACDSDDSGRYFLEPDEQLEVLSVCPHCLAAHNAIQARKAARKSLGAAKRQITMIGRAASKQNT